MFLRREFHLPAWNRCEWRFMFMARPITRCKMAPRWSSRNLNTSPDRNTSCRWPFRWLLVGLAVVCFAGTAQALDPNRAMSDYVRDRWGTQQGFPGGPVYAITQTADGYLWIGTEKGLVR